MKKSFLLVFSVLLTVFLLATGAAFADDGGETAAVPDNGIPVVYLTIDESQGTIEDMITSPDHSVYCYGTISIDVPDGFSYSDFPDITCEDLSEMGMQIRGRGNSTWVHANKKPFKIKLDSKTDIFGLGKNKHWALLANAMDPTLVKDRITGWLGDEMGFDFTPRGVPVDLVMTGSGDYGTQYLGSYYLTENVRVDTNRIEIDELEEDDTDPSVITGGYLLQDALQVRDGSPDRFTTDKGIEWATHTPSFDTEDDGYVNDAQQQYIQNYIQDFEDVLFDGSTAYRDLMDMESAAKYWWVNIFSLNGDAFGTSSTYIYKERDNGATPGKIYWGPLWDFDLAWGRTDITGFDVGHLWMKPMFCDRAEGGFLQEVKDQWPAMRAALTEIVEEGGLLDKYYEETLASAEQDRLIYDPEGQEADFKTSVEKLRTWINNRMAWVDENLYTLDDLAHRVEYIVDGEVYTTVFTDRYDVIDGSEDYPEKEGYLFCGWEDADGFILDYETDVTSDMALTAVYKPDSEAVFAEDIVFKKSSDIVRYIPWARTYDISYVLIPEGADEKYAQWSSSDEEVATVDNKGKVLFSGPGEVTLTATLRSGVSRTFTLKITEGEALVVPESISPEKDTITLDVGKQAGFTIVTDPDPANVDSFMYDVSDPGVAIVDSSGIITAMAPGETTVTVTTLTYDENGAEVTLTASAKVIVNGDDPEPEPSKIDNGIPVVYLNIDESEVTIDQMNSDPDHATKCVGTFTLDVPDGFHYSDAPLLVPEDITDMAMEIRGRGNSSWEASKKPYKIKLDKKTSVLGLGKNKHWVLVANAYDKTLIKDRITAWLGDEIGFEFTPTGYPVDVVMSGEQFGTKYLGSYYLSENVRVDDNRLEIDEIEETDTSEPEITGGYLLQNPYQTRVGSADVFTTKNEAGWATNTPTYDPEDEDGYDNPTQQQYIQGFIQKIDDALYSDDYTADGSDYRDLMDLESAAKYWLVNQVSMNNDAYYTGSTYIYKKRDTSDSVGKVYWGPLWDFDSAWGYLPDHTEFSIRHPWEKAMLYDTEDGGFVSEIKAQWPAVKDALNKLIEDGGIIDQYYEETLKSAEANRIVNPAATYDDEPVPSYLEEIQKLKEWIQIRTDWIDSHLADLDTIMHKVRFVVDDELMKMLYVEDNWTFKTDIDHPEKEGYVFLGWYDEDGNMLDTGYAESAPVISDITYTAKYITDEEATHGEDIVFQKQNDIIDYSSFGDYYTIKYTVVPRDAQDKVVHWTSSDESIATIDNKGKVHYYKMGTVTFTGTLYNGVSKEFTLTISEEPLPIPDSIRPEKEVIELTVGQQAGFTIVTDPDPAIMDPDSYEYETDDFEVAVVNSSGIITARGVGETTIHVKAQAIDENWDYHPYETQVTVIVRDSQPEPEPEYIVESGDKMEWTKGSGQDATITVKRSIDDESCFDHFTEVLLDGKILTPEKDYTAVKGSTVVTLKADTLETLSEGDHSITVGFDDGKADVTLTVNKAADEGSEDPSGDASGDSSGDGSEESKDKPKTGDSTNMAWFAVFFGAILSLASLIKIKGKSR